MVYLRHGALCRLRADGRGTWRSETREFPSLGNAGGSIASWKTRGELLTEVIVRYCATVRRIKAEDFGIPLSNLEPLAYIVGCSIALLIAILASLAPARRAASVQPMIAMRSE